jgi:allophanate hydrolase subunit 2
VPSCAFWKLGQSRPGDIYDFELLSVDEAQARKRAINAMCSEDCIEAV